MSSNKKSLYILFTITLSLISQFHSYPIFPTILTVSIPVLEQNYSSKEVFSEARVENNFLRWLQASGADLVVVHTWSSEAEIDTLLQKVNGVLFQGNLDGLNVNSPYYQTLKLVYNKVISLNDSGIKIPLLAIGDDVSLLFSIINNDETYLVSSTGTRFLEPNNMNLFLVPDKTIILNEFEKEDMKIFEENNILPNNLDLYISVQNFMYKLNDKFNLVATSKTASGEEYVAIAEGKKYPIIMVSFHPEYVPFEQNSELKVPDSLQAIYMSRFIGNGFVFYGRKNVKVEFPVEEKENYCYINPYGDYPEIINSRFNYLFKNTQ